MEIYEMFFKAITAGGIIAFALGIAFLVNTVDVARKDSDDDWPHGGVA